MADTPQGTSMGAGKWCKFCGQPKENVRQLIDGPADNAICNECIDLMYGMVHENAPEIIDLPPKDMAELADAIKAQASRNALLAEAARALEAMQAAYYDFHDSRSMTEPVTGRAANANALAIETLTRIRAQAEGRGE